MEQNEGTKTEEAPKQEVDSKAETRKALKASLEIVREITRALETGHFPGNKAEVIVAGRRYLEEIEKQIRQGIANLKD